MHTRGWGPHELQHHAHRAELLHFTLHMTHIHGTKRAAFPRSAPVGENCVEKVGRKIHILNQNIGSGKMQTRNHHAHVVKNERWQSLC